MTQLYRTSSNDRHAPSRSRLETVRPTHERTQQADEADGEPPVLLQLADFSQRSSRRTSRRPTMSLPQAALPLPVPPVTPPVAEEKPADQGRAESVASHVKSPDPSTVSPAVSPTQLETPVAAPARVSAPLADDVSLAMGVTNDAPTTEAGDEPPTFWDRMGSYRPSVPVLLGLVLATICVAYIYRPQETPPKRRGSLESTDSKRQFDKEFDDQRPKSLSAQNERRDDVTNPAGDAGGDAKMPKLDMPANAPGNSTATSASREAAASVAPPGSGQFSEAPLESAAGGEDPDGRNGAANNRTRLAGRPSPTEHFQSTPPPPMPDVPQVQPEGTNAADPDDDGPPPDITGRTYPQTNPMNFFYRPVAPETREASRPTSSQGETR